VLVVEDRNDTIVPGKGGTSFLEKAPAWVKDLASVVGGIFAVLADAEDAINMDAVAAES